MNVIAVHTTNGWHANARASVEAAASRWNCEVRVFDFAFDPHPSWARLDLPLRLSAFERALVMDPDMLISEDCPNLFASVPREVVGMVPEIQSPEDAVGPYPWNRALAGWRNVLGRPVRPTRHLQGGLCVYTPQVHGPTIERVRGWWARLGRPSFAPVYEQPLWHEVGERCFDLPIRRLSRLLNRHERALPAGPPAYITHLTGGEKQERLARFSWRGPARGPEQIVVAALAREVDGPRSLHEELSRLIVAAAMHQDVVVDGPGLAPHAWCAAHVVSGTVWWIGGDVALADDAFVARHLRTLATRPARSAPGTLHVRRTEAGGVEFITPDDCPPGASAGPLTRWTRTLWQPDHPVGRARARVVRAVWG